MNQLKDSLRLMHSFQIVHRDIKPDNIMWSDCHEKFVFIDFGFCCAIKEKINELTLTDYCGTFEYSSD